MMTLSARSLILPEATSSALFVVIGSPWGLLGCWLVLINLVTFLTFGVDKWKAKRKMRRESIRRVPEKTLFILAALGGSAGALLGMRVFHHKTLHKSFRFGIPAILVVQLCLVVGIWVYLNFIRA